MTTTFTATDGSGNWKLELIEHSSDGWHYGTVLTAPASMTQWVGNRMDFPPHQVTSPRP